MANIKCIEGKNGPSYKITVTKGRDLNGKQIRHYKTWVPEKGMTKRQMEKEVQRVAYEFEQELDLGYVADNRQTFAAYAEYVLKQKERGGAKFRTLDRYHELLERINPAIGHMKLTDIRPQHLNSFYDNLGEAGISTKEDKAQAQGDLYAVLKDKHMTRAQLASEAGVSATTITAACQGKKIALKTADAIAQALGMKTKALFDIYKAEGKLANKDDSGASPADKDHTGPGREGDAGALQRRRKSHPTKERPEGSKLLSGR